MGYDDHDLDRHAERRERPLDHEEIRALRRMLRDFERYRWLWGFIGRLSAWVGGVFAVVWAGRDLIARVIRAVFA
jgi:hypothetical protein